MDFIYKLDTLGPKLNFFIFKQKNYKSKFTLTFSIIVLIAIIAYSIYMIINFFNFSNPSVVYFQENNAMERHDILNLNETFFMLYKFPNEDDIFEEDINFRAYLVQESFGIEEYSIPLSVDKCEYGKNLNTSFKDLISNLFKEIDDSNLGNFSNYYCVGPGDDNFQNYSLTHDFIERAYLKIFIDVKDDKVDQIDESGLMYLTRNDYIDHFNKKETIQKFFYVRGMELNSETYVRDRIQISNVQYLSKNGWFIDSAMFNQNYNALQVTNIFKENENGDTLGDLDDDEEEDWINIGEIDYELDDFGTEKYIRTYAKLPSIFASISSMFSIFTMIGSIITSLISEDNVNCEIIKKLIDNGRKPIKYFNVKGQVMNINKENNNANNNAIEKLKTTNCKILKSKFCCCCSHENKKQKEIREACKEIMNYEKSFDIMLNRLILIENIYALLSEEKKNNINKLLPNEFEKIFQLINVQNQEDGIKNKNINDLSINNEIKTSSEMPLIKTIDDFD